MEHPSCTSLSFRPLGYTQDPRRLKPPAGSAVANVAPMTGTGTDSLVIRRAGAEDRPAVVALAAQALGWAPGEPHAQLFDWKHDQNPFGASPMWVAADAGRIVGFRAFLRWEFAGPDGEPVRAVRAVDTATHPDSQGRGIFTRLTLTALEQLAEEGVSFVFNTPNDQSRPGYLKMGWQLVGRVPVAVRLGGPARALSMLRARVPAGKWSVANRIGQSAAEVFGDAAATDELLTRVAPAAGRRPGGPGPLRTRRSGDFLRWRYAEAPLGYRVLCLPGGPSAGLAVFRLRRRGTALEATIDDLLVPPGEPASVGRLVRAVRRASRADYAIAVPAVGGVSHGLLPLPNQGPLLTWRRVAAHDDRGSRMSDWAFSLGDIELF